MKLTLARADLARTLSGVAKVVERRNTIPILSHLKLAAEGETLRVTGTDLDIALTASVPAEIERAGEITVQAAILEGYVRKLADDERVLIDATEDARSVVIRAGRGRTKLHALDAIDFPAMDEGATADSFTMPGRDLDRFLGAVQMAISTEETRFYLNGIFLHVIQTDSGPTLRGVATDGHRLGRIDRPCTDGAMRLSGVIVPRKAVAEMRRIAEAAGEDPVSVAIGQAKIVIESLRDGRGIRLVSKLVDGTFPDYLRVIPTANDKIALFDAGPFARAIDRVSTISSERGRKIKLSLAEGGSTLAMNNPDAGSASEDVDAAYEASPIIVAFNARYALDILAALDAETVEVALSDPGSPMVWRNPADSSRLYVLMPMRV